MGKEIASVRLVVVGRVLAPRGLQGEVHVETISDSPGRFCSGGMLYLNSQPRKIQWSSSLPSGRVVLKLEDINSRTDAESIRGHLLMVPEDMVPSLADGNYYHYQIIDIQVYSQQREYLGQITQIISTGSNDVYVVSLDGRELLIPALDEVIKEVDVVRAVMTVDLPEGLNQTVD